MEYRTNNYKMIIDKFVILCYNKLYNKRYKGEKL